MRTILAVCCLAAMPAFNVNATTVTFDNLTVAEHEPGEKVIPENTLYSGLTWLNFGTANPIKQGYIYSGYGTLQSDENDWVAFNRYADPATITSDTPWTWEGMQATSAWLPENNLIIHGYLAGQEVFNRAVNVYDTSITDIAGDQALIDTLTLEMENVAHAQYGWFGLDDFQYQPAAPVPEPATMVLFLTGMGVLAIGKRGSRLKKLK